MKDPVRKSDAIHSIKNLQLSDSLIVAMDDAHQAQCVIEALDSLKDLIEQWN